MFAGEAPAPVESLTDRLKEELGATTQRYTSAVEQVSDAVAKAIAAEAALAKFKAEANTRLAGYVVC